MRNILFAMGSLIIGLAVGYSFGHEQGITTGYAQRDAEQHEKSYAQLREEIHKVESTLSEKLIVVKASVETKDEGGLFTVKLKYYLEGTILNSAMATTMKDVVLQVDYISKTKSIISSEKITLYHVISPLEIKSFREQITPPPHTESYQYSLISVKAD